MAETTAEMRRRMEGTGTQATAVTSDNPEEIKAQIEQTRAQMGETIDEIQTRLSPQYLKQQTQDTIREATVEKVEKMAHNAENKVRNLRRGTMETIKENPIPVALIGLGIGWMLLSDGNGDQEYGYYERRPYPAEAGYQYYDRREGQFYEPQTHGELDRAREKVSSAAHEAREWVDDTVNTVKDKASEAAGKAQQKRDETVDTIRTRAEQTAEQTQETVHRMEVQARRQMYHAKRTFWQTMNENPLALGVAALAAGALVGLALPTTNMENQFMGETRDRLVENAKREAKETVQKVQNVAEQAQHAAVEEAKSEAEKQNLRKSDSSEEKSEQNRATMPTVA